MFQQSLDFVFVAMKLSFLFSHIKIHNDYLIPLVKRYSAKVIREFRRLGFKQQESRSTIYDTSSNDQIIKSYKCFGINIP